MSVKEVNLVIPDFNSIANLEDRIAHMYRFCWSYRFVVPSRALAIAEEALALARQENLHLEEGISLSNVGFQHWTLSKIEQAMEELEQASEILRKYNAYKYIANCFMPLAMINWGRGNRDTAFNLLYEAIHLLDESEEMTSKFWPYWALGVYYFDLEDYVKSQENYERAIELFDTGSGDDGDYCFLLIGLGTVCKVQGEFKKALSYFERVKQFSQSSNQWMQEARSYFEIGTIHKLTGNYSDAQEGFVKSYLMRKSQNMKPGMISCLLECAELILLKNEDASDALELLYEALELAEETQSKQKLSQCHLKISEIHKADNNFELALKHIEEHFKTESELSGAQASNKLKKLETEFATENAQKEAEIHKLINIDLKAAHEGLEEKNQEILDSIRYARRIQLALFPSDEILSQYLKDSFLFYEPKGIVGGDFYWLEVVNEKVFYAVADCTGHGVPGAILSVMCSTALSKAVKEMAITKPNLILDKTVELLDERFSKSSENVNDGMDIALCSIDFRTMKLEYAGANNSLYYVRKNHLAEIKADKQPVGKFANRKPYSHFSMDLLSGDMIYLFSDGFADQFGGERGKKFMYKPFKRLLTELSDSSMVKQRAVLEQTFNDWKGELEQIDDVCVLGVRV